MGGPGRCPRKIKGRDRGKFMSQRLPTSMRSSPSPPQRQGAAGGSGKFLTHFLQLTDSHFYHRLPTATLLPGDFRVGLFLERDLCFWLQNKDLIIVGGSCPKGLRCSDALSQLPAEEIHWTDSKIFGKYESITKHVNIGSRIKNTRITLKM